MYAIKSPATREKYIGRLGKFFEFLGLEGSTAAERSIVFATKGKVDAGWVFNSILRFMQVQRERAERKEISAGTIRNYVKAIKLFCEMKDIPVAWKRITRGLPRCRRFAEDRAPTIEEIRQIIEFPDRRIKAVVYAMCSSGMRLEGWENLRWGHITAIEREGRVVAAKIIIYPGDPEEYFSFISAEAYNAINDWMTYRKRAGEKKLIEFILTDLAMNLNEIFVLDVAIYGP